MYEVCTLYPDNVTTLVWEYISIIPAKWFFKTGHAGQAYTVFCQYCLLLGLSACRTNSILYSLSHSGGGVSEGCCEDPTLWGSHTLNGVSHNEGVGGCSLGGMEHRGLNLWLHPHQCHGRAHSLVRECYNHPPVCYWPAVCWTCGPLHLHSAKEALTQDFSFFCVCMEDLVTSKGILEPCWCQTMFSSFERDFNMSDFDLID